MKGLLYTFFIVFALACVCVVTCPDRNDHSDALKQLINTIMTDELSKDVETEEDAGWAMIGSMFGTGIGGLVIDNILKVDNYFVCSIGTITYEGECRMVSLGIMNHVFTIPEDKAREAAANLL